MHEEFGEAVSEGDKRVALLLHPFVFERKEAFEEVAKSLEGVLHKQLLYDFALSILRKRRREVSARALLEQILVVVPKLLDSVACYA
jgi:hypothetical protein